MIFSIPAELLYFNFANITNSTESKWMATASIFSGPKNQNASLQQTSSFEGGQNLLCHTNVSQSTSIFDSERCLVQLKCSTMLNVCWWAKYVAVRPVTLKMKNVNGWFWQWRLAHKVEIERLKLCPLENSTVITRANHSPPSTLLGLNDRTITVSCNIPCPSNSVHISCGIFLAEHSTY